MGTGELAVVGPPLKRAQRGVTRLSSQYRTGRRKNLFNFPLLLQRHLRLARHASGWHSQHGHRHREKQQAQQQTAEGHALVGRSE